MVNALRYFLIVAISCGVAVGCSQGASSAIRSGSPEVVGFDPGKLRPLIEAKNAQFTQAHVDGDRALIDTMFTDDARVLPPNAAPVIGRAAIDQLTAEYLAYGISEFREETTDLYGTAELLIDQGNYIMVFGEDHTVEQGKYLNVWKFVDGDWKIYSNIWSANAAQ